MSSGNGKKVRSLRFVARLSGSQHRRLDDVLGMCCELYNAGLEAWRTGYRMWLSRPDPNAAKMRFSYMDNCKTFTQVRADDSRWSALHTNVGRGVLLRLDRSIQGFYDGIRGYPRFKSRHRWRSITVPGAYSGMLQPPSSGGRWWRLSVKGLPGLRFDGERLAGLDDYEVLELRVVRTALRVELHVVIHEPVPAQIAVADNPVGLDAGIKHRYTFSDGSRIAQRSHNRTVLKRRQRAVSRAQPGSAARRRKVALLAKEHARRAERRRDEDFRIICELLKLYDGFAVEDLRIANMVRNRRLADKIMQQGWAAFADRLQHQAERAGLRFERVDPAYTTQDCSVCGHRLTDRLTLAERIFVCENCGHTMCRDINAAINIRDRGHPSAVPGGTTQQSVFPERAAKQTSGSPQRKHHAPKPERVKQYQ